MSIGLKRLQHLVLWVSDVERSVRFYVELLGFEDCKQYEDVYATGKDGAKA